MGKLLVTAFIALAFSLGLSAQNLVGNATALGGNCYLLTPDVMWQSGAVWFPDTLNLNQPFHLIFSVNLGHKDVNGADGMVFVLQNSGSNVLGLDGGSLGFNTLSPSLGIEFDTFENTNVNDPPVDHIAIMRDGSNVHGSAQNLAGPVQAAPVLGNIEDSLDHPVEVIWQPATGRLEVYFDCSLRLALNNYDIVNTIFGGDSTVFWGFTAASGGSYNPQSVCLLQAPAQPSNFSLTLCQGDTVQLRGPAAPSWSWSPAYNISSTTVRDPLVAPATDTVYVVSYPDLCGNPQNDSFFVNILRPNDFSLGNDTTLCGGQSLTLDATTQGGSYQWSNGATSAQITVSDSGLYAVTVTTGGCVLTDSILLNLQPDLVELGPNQTFCEGDSLLIQNLAGGSSGGNSYAWSTGASTPDIWVYSAGLYILEVSNGFCLERDSIAVSRTPLPVSPFDRDNIGCEGSPISLNPTGLGYTYQWSNGQTGLPFILDSTATWTVTITNGGICPITDTVNVEIIPAPTVDLGIDTVYCGGGHSVRLDATNPQADYMWSTGSLDSVITVSATGTYEVTVTNICGSASGSVSLTFFPFEEGYFLPNVFTPNGDQINDRFLVEAARPEEYSLSVYDRWGNEVFVTRNHEEGWDGKIGAQNAPEGVYFYVINTTDCTGLRVRFADAVTLLR